jgi:hypothetical protein
LNTFLPQNYSYNYNQIETNNPNKLRADLIREIMFHQSNPTGQETIASRSHSDLDLTGMLALGRPMIVAQVDRPGTQLLVDGSSDIAKTSQTTVLRVILPIKKDKEAEPSKSK